MKNYSNILLSLGVTLFLLTVGMKSEVEAQCTSPWQTKTEIVNVGGCNYEVTFCLLCTFSYPGQVKVKSVRSAGPCSSMLSEEDIILGAENQLMNPYSLWFNLCNSNLPPCRAHPPVPPFVITLETPICWKIKLEHKDISDSTKNVYLSYPCDDDAYCEITHTYCVDRNNVIQHTEGGYFGYNFDPECTLESYEIVRPTVEGDSSDCFIIHTKCNEYKK